MSSSSSWQSPSGRIRQAAQARKLERERNKPRLKLQKVQADIKVTGHARDPQFASGQVVLNDFSPNGVSLFTHQPLMVGDEVSLTLERPKQFYIHGRIISCQEFDTNSKILTTNTPSYRVGVQFTFESERERAEVRSYCDYIVRDVLFGRRAA